MLEEYRSGGLLGWCIGAFPTNPVEQHGQCLAEFEHLSHSLAVVHVQCGLPYIVYVTRTMCHKRSEACCGKILYKSIDSERRARSGAAGDRKANGF